ncbi:DNA-3-methyladenine glycosylase I [Bacillus mangrovi]|uniref:DNA-3-methyladenine glycosylase I n=1 Tax=Metabacillus mangrovi TaxID=1491830 RepID=A0A7X2S722_9BACI|nr:DNA-3-methyladenine glycosylase I [Metabacillus mangrovi]MTH54849.1 DNA-3-methyladenine glycosylase I [Metabacillus mangrovi]
MSTCLWPGNNQLMKEYHDREWCIPNYDDRFIFEMLTLEGAQSGLSWNIVLSKRESYKKAFHNFDISYCANLTEEELESIKDEYQVIKHLAKIRSVKNNAIRTLNIQKEFGSLSTFLWQYVQFTPLINKRNFDADIPAQTDLSIQLSKDLKKRGFKFVGPVIIYSFMQAIGMVDDHIESCPFHTHHRTS